MLSDSYYQPELAQAEDEVEERKVCVALVGTVADHTTWLAFHRGQAEVPVPSRCPARKTAHHIEAMRQHIATFFAAGLVKRACQTRYLHEAPCVCQRQLPQEPTQECHGRPEKRLEHDSEQATAHLGGPKPPGQLEELSKDRHDGDQERKSASKTASRRWRARRNHHDKLRGAGGIFTTERGRCGEA